MADVIVVASGKGGVGKSTLTVSIADALNKKGKKIMLIDADEALNSLDIMLCVREKAVFGWNDVADGNCDVKKAEVKCDNGISLLTSPQKCDNREKLIDIVNNIKNDYDYIIIDAPAGIGDDFINCVECCDKLIIVATADGVSVTDGFKAYMKATEHGVTGENIRLVINRYDKKAAVKQKLLNIDGVIDRTGVRLLGVIPEDKNIMFSSVTGMKSKKNKKFNSAVERIADRIEGKNVELKI